jgi:hypothetical protein
LAGRSDIDQRSIDAYGINRDKLIETRREYLNNIRLNYYFSDLDLGSMTLGEKAFILKSFNIKEAELIELIEEARRIVYKAPRADSPFAAMERHNYPNLPRE